MYQRFKRAEDLPKEWDVLCKDNVYLLRDFLAFMEKANPCSQSYHAFYENGKLNSCFVMFERKFNLFIFTPLNIKVNMKFIYLPLSASESSIIFCDDNSEMEQVLHTIKGVKIIINTDKGETLQGFTQGAYLPVCILDLKWSTFEEYISSLRSNYRYRYKKALKKGDKIGYEILSDNNNFNPKMYELYEQVFDHAEYSLEKLEPEFFKNDISKIVNMKVDGNTVAMIQMIEDKKRLIFEFGGYNYEVAHKYDLYHNMLLFMLRYAIENGFSQVHYGQTAYDAKMKLGCKLYEKYYLLSHSNRLINFFIKRLTHYMEYKYNPADWDFNVFRSETF